MSKSICANNKYRARRNQNNAANNIAAEEYRKKLLWFVLVLHHHLVKVLSVLILDVNDHSDEIANKKNDGDLKTDSIGEAC